MEEARGDQGITTIVARSGDHEHALVPNAIHECLNKTGNLPAGDLHQLQRLDTKFVARPRVRLAQSFGR